MEIVFYIISAILVISGISVISQKKPINSAISLIVNLLAMAIFYFVLGSELLGTIQIIVYAGAVIVLFLFVIMIFGNYQLPKETDKRILMVLIPVIFIFLVISALIVSNLNNQISAGFNIDIKILSKTLFTKYLLQFELISILFLIGIIGVVVLAKKQ